MKNTSLLFLYFNSIKVRLEHKAVANLRQLVRYFNSIKVRLELSILVLIMFFLYDFNSIKVRLEQEEFSRKFAALLFQFHKGTIRTQILIHALIRYDISIP